jgi:integrase
VVAYTDHGGVRRIKSFAKRREADAYHAVVRVDVRRGIHTADSRSGTIAEAGQAWLMASAGLERATVRQYEQHLQFHIVPLIGAVKLSQLTAPAVRAFEARLAQDRSPAMVRKVLVSLGSIVAEAQERGLVAQNVVRGLRRRRPARTAQRQPLRVGVDIPAPSEIAAIIAYLATGPLRPLLLTAIFTGLRASELRGLRWTDVDLKAAVIHIRQRADRYGAIGRPKSAAGERAVPIPPLLVNTLREWKLACTPSAGDLAFANRDGGPHALIDIIQRAFHPAQVAAGVVGAGGKAKYGGLHSLRHFYASWCINRRVDGGLELPLKVVSARLGHAGIQITADRYGHLFPSMDDGAEMAAAERLLVVRGS